jgi:membrane-associated phospholipid phosphatase
MWEDVTNLGDAALIVPASLALCIYLWAAGFRRAALAWGGALLSCAALAFLLKVGFRTCHAQLGEFAIVSPSGHAALATTLYGSVAVLFARGCRTLAGVAVGLSAAALSGAVGVSRVMLHAHTALEVSAGLLIGLTSIAAFRAAIIGERQFALPAVPAMMVFAALAVAVHGQHLNLEGLIADISEGVHEVTGVCLDQ